MRDAAVGFQCPECVQQGHKETRQGLSRYGGARSADPRLTSYAIIALNVVVWLAITLTGGARSRLIDLLALSPVGRCTSTSAPGQWYPSVPDAAICSAGTGGDGQWQAGVADGAWWQLISSAFTHVDFWHIGFNMLALYVLGPQLEAVLGRIRFLALYLLSGVAGSVAAFWLSEPLGYTLGASGAIYGIFGALVVLTIKLRTDPRSMLGLLAVNLFITFAIPNISWQGHLGGLLGGAAVTALVVYAPRKSRTVVQWGGLAALAVLLLALSVARALTLA